MNLLIVTGLSGAGKSLTIQALAGLIRPKLGFLRVAGEAMFDAERGVFVPPVQLLHTPTPSIVTAPPSVVVSEKS